MQYVLLKKYFLLLIIHDQKRGAQPFFFRKFYFLFAQPSFHPFTIYLFFYEIHTASKVKIVSRCIVYFISHANNHSKIHACLKSTMKIMDHTVIILFNLASVSSASLMSWLFSSLRIYSSEGNFFVLEVVKIFNANG